MKRHWMGVVVALLAVALSAPLWGDGDGRLMGSGEPEATYMDSEFEQNLVSGGIECIVTPQSNDYFGWGVNARAKFRRLSLGVDLEWMGRQYYDYAAGGWVGPAGWDVIRPSTINWLFYHDILILNLDLAYHFAADWLQPYAGVGVSLAFTAADSNALSSYPGFAAYYRSHGAGLGTGAYVFGGADIFPGTRFFSLGAEYRFRLDDFVSVPDNFAMSGIGYLLSCSHVLVTAKAWF
jgi:hypothetical protein